MNVEKSWLISGLGGMALIGWKEQVYHTLVWR